jgi:hypothetical protein
MTPIGQKLKVHQVILDGKLIEFRSRYGDGRWVPCYGGLTNMHGEIDISWQDGDYREAQIDKNVQQEPK